MDPMTDKETKDMLLFFFLGWVFIVGVLPWIMWSEGTFASALSFYGYAIPVVVVLSLLSLVSVPFGWYLGYKWGWAPLFTAKIMFHKK